jgi:hypothetical protein
MDFQFYSDEHVNKLQVYIEENFMLDGAAKHLVNNILRYVAAQSEEPEYTMMMLMSLLDGIGITAEEIKDVLK